MSFNYEVSSQEASNNLSVFLKLAHQLIFKFSNSLIQRKMAVKDFILFITVCIFSHLAGVAQSDFCKKLNQPGLIFCDDFESTQAISSRYFEYNNNNGDFVPLGGLGRNSSTGMRVRWQPGEVGAGSLSKQHF